MGSARMGARPRRYAVAVLTFGAAVLCFPSPAAAHPYLVQTLPGPGAVLTGSPEIIEIGFTERVVLAGSSLRLEDAGGRPVPLGPLREPGGGPGLSAAVEPQPLDPAVYRVLWVVLGNDGHTSSGDFRFGVAGPNGRPPPGAEALAATGGPSDQNAAPEGPVRVGLRWLGLLGASLLLGGVILLARWLGPHAPLAARSTTVFRWGFLLVAAGSVGAVAAAASAGAGDAGLDILLATNTGALALVRLGAVLLLGVPAVLLRPGSLRNNLLALTGVIFLEAEALSGHVSALTTYRTPAGLAQSIHLAAAGVWVGGLATLAVVLARTAPEGRSAAWREAAAGFGPVAAVCAVVVVVTGTIAAVREVKFRYFLLWSGYGRFLLVKLALVAAMLVLGAQAGAALRRRRRAGAGRPLARLLRPEAVLGAAVLVFAAILAGVAPGRDQPLPAQRDSVLAGPAFANAVVGGGLARVILAPATPGPNRLAVLTGAAQVGPAPVPAEGGERSDPSATVEVSLACDCSERPLTVRLDGGAGTWHGEVDLPAEGLWRASVVVGGRPSLAPVALRVAEGGAPGAPPVVVASTADLSGPDARRCRSFQLGLLLSLGFLNAEGGVEGRKVVVEAVDDAGDPDRAARLARRLRGEGADLAVPCGRGAGAAARALGEKVPVVLADAQAPPVAGERIFRLAGDPYAEGWAVGRTVATSAFVGRLEAPRRVAVVADDGDPGLERAVAGLEAAMALDPRTAEAAEGRKSEDASDVEMDVLTRRAADPLLPLVRQGINGARYVAVFFRAEPAPLAQALDQLTDEEITLAAAVLVPPRHFDEQFYRGSKLGRRGDISVFGEVAPDSGTSLVYTRLVFSLFPGEQPTIDGFRGYMAGLAIAKGLAGGASAGGVARRLQFLGPFSDGVVSGWSPAAAAAGSWRFFLYKGSFIPAGLIPKANPEPGRFFPEGGAWSRIATGNIGLCGPQEKVGGPAPDCKPRQRKGS